MSFTCLCSLLTISTPLLADSGIALTVKACTFFRNYAYFCGSLSVIDAWPLTSLYADTDFLHSEAYSLQHDCIEWTPFVRLPLLLRIGYRSS